MTHYNLEAQTEDIRVRAAHNHLMKPEFIGQGWSRQVGSDCYGGYVTAIKKTATGKPLIGLTGASSKFTHDWMDGSMECSLDMATAKPTKWITTYGTDGEYGPKWWYCDETGNRKINGYTNRCRLNWNGAREYRDPSF